MIKKFILPIYKEYLYNRNRLLCKINPKLAANIVYKKVTGRNINFENPQDLIEKIAWLELNTDTSLWTFCSDKYRVREFVKERGCEETLVKLYGAWQDPYDIDFDKLPKQFVIKANNGCGTVMIVKDKNELNIEQTKRTLKKWIRRPYGYSSSQLHYLSIVPCIIAEELLFQHEALNKVSPKSIVDYKVWCFNGEPESILVTFNRTKESLNLKLYSTDWEDISHNIVYGGHYPKCNELQIPKPECLALILESAKKLSYGFPEVRVDFYVIDNKPKFGELTFSTGFGYFTDDYYKYLGGKIDLSKIVINH